MLPKSKRIQRKTAKLLLKGAKFSSNDLFLLRFVPSSEKNSRFSFSVSKKVAKSAVVRNRMRRFGYRSVEHYIPSIKQNVLVSFSFKNIPKTYEEVDSGIEAILRGSNLIK